MRKASDLNDFIFLPSRTFHRDREKTYPTSKGEWVPYETDAFEEEWASQKIDSQISSTVSSIQSATLKSAENAYFVLGLSGKQMIHENGTMGSPRIFLPKTRQFLSNLSAEILAYLNPTHDKLLVSCPLPNLSQLSERSNFRGEQFEAIRRFSPLLYNEIVPTHLKGAWQESKLLAIHLMPNISNDLVRGYLKQIIDYLSNRNRIIDWDDTGIVFADLKVDEATELIKTSNFIFYLNEVPKTSVEKFRKSQNKNGKSLRIKSSVASASVSTFLLPIICVMDTGVSSITPLQKSVIQRDGVSGFLNYGDDYPKGGHGTPVACLAALGKTLNRQTARIISYKVWGHKRETFAYKGFIQAINKYSAAGVRLFTSSVVFDHQESYPTAQLNKLIQQKNICVTFSAGNILTDEMISRINNGSPYPSYIRDYPVKDPSRAVNILSVGAITEKDSLNSIAGKHKLSPFTRCGTATPNLFNCPKPEIVQHGGNQCDDGSITNIGVDSFDSKGNSCCFIGTSFATPLVMHEISKIEGKYGKQIKNAETLKAVALAFSKIHKDSHNVSEPVRACLGFGETKFENNCDTTHALLITEGTIPLTDKVTQGKKNRFFKSRIRKIRIPKFIQKIEVFLVHSDDNFKTTTPSLTTYLKLYAKKTGNEKSYAQLANPEENSKKSHVKLFRYEYKRKSMEGTWRFYITGEPTFEMHPEDMRKTNIRYGCAILVTAKSEEPRLYPLTQEIYNKNRHLWKKEKISASSEP